MSTDAFLQDLRHAARSLARRPGQAVAVIASLALVIGANVSVFSYLSFLLWQDLPVQDPASLVSLDFETPAGAVPGSYPDYLDLRAQSQGVLSGMAAYGITSAAVDTGPETLHAWLHLVTGNYLPLLGVDARLGRRLGEEDDHAGAARAVVLSHAFWRRAFGGDRSAVGRTVHVNGHAFTVVGVMPESFIGTGLPADAYVTISQEALLRVDGRDHRNDRDYAWLGLVGRLRQAPVCRWRKRRWARWTPGSMPQQPGHPSAGSGSRQPGSGPMPRRRPFFSPPPGRRSASWSSCSSWPARTWPTC